MTTTRHLGRRPATYDSRDLRWADVRPSNLSLPSFPKPGGGYGMDFGSAGWLMLGNGPDDTVSSGFGGCGDCVWAGAGHEHMEGTKNAGRPVPVFSGKTIVEQYGEYSGYNPLTGANDTGSDVREVMKWRQTKGLRDDRGNAYQIGTYVSLEPGNLQHLWEALWLFQCVGIGVNFPGSAMDQTNNGQRWSVVPGAQIDGGHYVPLVGHPTNNVWTCVTWGARQEMTAQWLTTYCEEAWAYIDPLRYNSLTGKTQQGWRDADLEQYIAQLAKSINP